MTVKKALTFRAASIGDSLMGKYLLENIRAAYPDAHFELAVSSRAGMLRDLFAAYSWIRVVEVNKKPRSLWRYFRIGRRDIVVTPYTGGVFALFPKLAARAMAKALVGYTDTSSINSLLYTKLIPLVGRARAPRMLECDALQALSIPVAIERPSFQYVPQPELLARLGLEEKKYVVLHLFSGSRTRGLSPERKRALIETLAANVSLPIVLTGSSSETASLGALPSNARAVQTTLQELAHLIDHAGVIVSLDTGAAHMAAHMRKPLIVLASCVGVQWWGSDMYGDKIPTALFTRLDVCKDGHDYSGYAPCLDAIDMSGVVLRAVTLLNL